MCSQRLAHEEGERFAVEQGPSTSLTTPSLPGGDMNWLLALLRFLREALSEDGQGPPRLPCRSEAQTLRVVCVPAPFVGKRSRRGGPKGACRTTCPTELKNWPGCWRRSVALISLDDWGRRSPKGGSKTCTALTRQRHGGTSLLERPSSYHSLYHKPWFVRISRQL